MLRASCLQSISSMVLRQTHTHKAPDTYSNDPTLDLDLRHARTVRTRRSSTRTHPTTTRLAEHDKRDDHRSRVPSPGKPEESNRGLGLTAAFLAVKAPVGDFVVDGVVLEPVLAVCRLTIQYR